MQNAQISGTHPQIDNQRFILGQLQISENKTKRSRKRAPAKKKAVRTSKDEVVHRKKTLRCDFCLRLVGTKPGLKYHINVHLFGRRFKCDVCPKSYSTKNDLTTHKKTHTDPITCDFCQKTFNTKHNAADHIAGNHLPKVLPCEMCKRPYATKTLLNRHMYMYHCPKPTMRKPAPKNKNKKRRPRKDNKKPRSSVTYMCDLCGEVLTHSEKMTCTNCQEKFNLALPKNGAGNNLARQKKSLLLKKTRKVKASTFTSGTPQLTYFVGNRNEIKTPASKCVPAIDQLIYFVDNFVEKYSIGKN